MLICASALVPSLAAAGGNVGWSVSVGGPGFAITAGQPAYGPGYAGPVYVGAPYRSGFRPYLRPVVYAPPAVYATPVVYASWVAPAVAPPAYRMYAPRPVVYARPVVVPVRRHLPVTYPVAPHPYRY
jgi:hypothetical protein